MSGNLKAIPGVSILGAHDGTLPDAVYDAIAAPQGPTPRLFDHVAACIRQGHATEAMAANVDFLKTEFFRAFRSIDDAVADRTDELQRENSLWSERLEDQADRLALAIETLEYYADQCSRGHHPLEMPARKALMKLKEPMP